MATQTARYVRAVAGLPCQVLDTRKTTPGWRLLEKYAVRCGGGHNHRMGLGDGVLIKDNHLAVVGGGTKAVVEAVRLARAKYGARFSLEIEVDDLVQLDAALASRPDIVLLDNMKPDLLREAVRGGTRRRPAFCWRRPAASPCPRCDQSRKPAWTASASAPLLTPRPRSISPWIIKPMHDEEWSLNSRLVGRRVLFFECVDSTNTVAARLADDRANDGLAVLAAEQTAGRGQHGRQWQCRPGDGVLLSVLLFPPPALRQPAVLTAWAAVAVCETVRRLTGLQARIKWPNDVLLRGRKVCGILIEQGRGAVVGVGLNVRQPAEFAAAGLPHGASLTQFTDAELDSRAVAKVLLYRMDEEYTRLLEGDLATLEACWKRHVGLLGREVIAERYDGPTHRGRLLQLGFAGVQLEAQGSAALTLPPEMVRHLEALDEE